MTDFGEFKWPPGVEREHAMFLNFALQIMDRWPVDFPGVVGQPVELLRNFLSGRESYEACKEAYARVWEIIDEYGLNRDFTTKFSLSLRIALFLIPHAEAFEFPEAVGAFVEMCSWYGLPGGEINSLSLEYFSMSEQP